MHQENLGVFTLASVTENTGETEHEQLQEIEVIFGTFQRIDDDALRRCRNLQRLTMVNCNLVEISGLNSVGESLVHLCLSNQNITQISGLSALRQLRHLYLQQNRISRIEGLQSCRKLKTLWLYDNCLTKVDNLGFCSDLRELWLQNNRIQSLKATSGGISDLVNLQKLNLANNRIRDVDELDHLRKLIALRQLTFADEHFGSNPIVHQPDYRSFAITTIKQLRQLDGIPVESDERSTAEDRFFTQSMDFNDQLAELTLAYQQELRSISMRQERGTSNAKVLQQELIEALDEVESCVMAGQSRIQEEKQRQLQLREQNSQLLQENVEKLQQDVRTLMVEQFEREEKALADEEQEYEIMELEAMAEQKQALTIAALQNSFPNEIVFQQLLQHMPDYRYIAEGFRRPAHQQREATHGTVDDDDREVHILQIYRFFHEKLTSAFETTARQVEKQGDVSVAQGSELYLYLVADDDEVTSLLQDGLVSPLAATHGNDNESSSHGWVYLFSNPLVALQFYKGTVGELEPLSDNETDDDLHPIDGLPEDNTQPVASVESFNLLLCQVRMHQIIELFHSKEVQLFSLEELHSVASPRGSVLPPPPTAFLQLELGGRDSWSTTTTLGGNVYMARKTAIHTQVLPQFVLLCSKRGGFSGGRRNPNNGSDNEDQAINNEYLIAQFQQRLRAEVDAYHSRLYHEMDPATVRVEAQLQHESEQLRTQLKENEERINQEKQEQERMLRTLRAGGNRKASGRRR